MIIRADITFEDNASPALARQAAALQPRLVARAIGGPLRETVRNHLARRPSNKRGWPSTRFWESAARGTTWEPTEEGVLIHIKKLGFRQRYFGGVIRAVTKRFLTIPISPLAYGKTVADFPGSFLMVTKKGAYIVRYGGAMGARGRMRRHNATLQFLFKLQASVNQVGDKDILPTRAALMSVARQALHEYFTDIHGGGAT